jgi:molecular chaperone DnaK (HSP70)
MKQNAYCFGIDLGTSNSSICYINPLARHPLPYVHIEPVTIPKAESDDCSPRLPSVLYSTGKTVKFGYQALSTWKQGRLWESMFPSAKSDLGAHRFYEDSLNEDLDTPVKVQAEILRRLILAARERTGEDPRKSKVVITVPASFEMGQRKDTLLAAELAGLNVGDGDLMDEPNAAFLDLVNSQAIDRLDLSKPKNILVFDFGGGTCDISVLRIRRDDNNVPLGLLIENLAISNYARLGGDNIDLLLVHEKLSPAVCRASGIKFETLSEKDKRELRWNIKETARRLKERLCERACVERGQSRSTIPPQAWTVDPFTLSDSGITTKKTRGAMVFNEFEVLLEPFFGRLMDNRIVMADGYYAGSVFAPVLEALSRAQLSPDAVDAVLLNGGSCRNPLIARAFKELDIFGHAEILDQGNLDLAVARGATVRCYYKHHQKYDPITPIVNAEIGLITHGDHHETLVAAGTLLPYPAGGGFAKFKDRFWIPRDNMQQVHFPVCSGKDGNRSLVQTLSLDLPPHTKSRDSVIIELQIDLNKMMCFRAFLASHAEQPLEVKLENPLATRIPSSRQRIALAERKRLQEKRLRNRLYHPSPQELINLANLERRAGEAARGLEVLQRLETRMKKENQMFCADAHNIMALCYDELGQRERAHDHYKLAAELEPGNAVYAANYGFTLLQMGKTEESICHLKRAVSLDPDNGYPCTILGDALRQSGHEEEALAEFRQAKKVFDERLRANPTNTLNLDWAEGVCRRLGDYEEAGKYRGRCAEIHRTEQLGVPLDQLVAGLDSGIIPQSEIQHRPRS